MKKLFVLLIFFSIVGIGIRVGYDKGILKEPIDKVLGKQPKEVSVDIEADPKAPQNPKNPKKDLANEDLSPEKIKPIAPDNPEDLSPGQINSQDQKRAKTLLKEALTLAKSGRYKQAREQLKKVRKLKVDNNSFEETKALYDKLGNFYRITKFIEPFPLPKNGSVDLVEYVNGNLTYGVILEQDSKQIKFKQLNNITGTIPRHRIEKIKSMSRKDAKKHFMKEFQKKKNKASSGPKGLYDLIEYSCKYKLTKELHPVLEEMYQKNPNFAKPIHETIAKKIYKKYIWLKAQGKTSESKKQLEYVLGAFKHTAVASMALEDKDPTRRKKQISQAVEKAKIQPSSSSTKLKPNASAADLVKAGDRYHRTGMKYLKKAQPGAPNADENLAKAKKEFEKAVQTFDKALLKGGDSSLLDAKLEKSSEMLYFCIKQTRLAR